MKKKLKQFTIFIYFICESINYCFAQAPTIVSFTPLSAKPGDNVIITGTNFNTTTTNNIIFFGATKATVTSASSTALTVNVPIGSTHDYINILNTGTSLSCASRLKFIPTFSPSKSSIGTSDFSPKVDFVTAEFPQFLAICDIDGDGKADLISSSERAHTISVFRNTSTNGIINASSFADKVDFITFHIPLTGNLPPAIAIGDLDSDGKPDLVIANPTLNLISVLKNTSTVGTINTNSFATKVDFTTGTDPRSIAIGDLDGDGKSDIVVANYIANTVSVLSNTSTVGTINSNSFATKVDFNTGTLPRSIAIGDLDGDGKLDLAIGNTSNTISVLKNNITGGVINTNSFATKVDFASGNEPYSIAMSDVNGDGKLDLATISITNAISVLRNNVTGGSISTNSFAAKVDFTTGTTPYAVAISDINGDGKLDLASANYFSNDVSIIRNISTNTNITVNSFAAKVDFNTSFSPSSMAIGDLDGDGKPDLAIVNRNSSTISLLRNADMALPITIKAFTATIVEKTAILHWSSSSEINALEYVIERSINGRDFDKIGTVATKGAANEYQFTDLLTTNYTLPTSIFYRLKLVDKDGKYSYSEVKQLAIRNNNLKFTIYPNPVKKLINIVSDKGIVEVRIVNTIGQEMLKQKANGANNLQLSIANYNLNKGIYFIEVNTKDGSKSMEKFIKE